MKLRGSHIVVKALEDAGARFAFGIPGTHNIELYDALEDSASVTPILVTDEQGASFMADAVSRTSASVGVVNVVPGAGVTHCLSGVAEAFMDGIPLVVLTCGIRSDSGRAYQLHDIDQLALLKPVTKGAFRPTSADEIYAMVRRAFDLARHGTPGPVAVEIPAHLYMLTHEMASLEYQSDLPGAPLPATPDVEAAAALLNGARQPIIYIGLGAASAGMMLPALADRLGAPVATTIQGKGVFSETHPLWLWNMLGASAPEFVRDAFDACDAMLAIGCRFSEVGTGSYGFAPPAALVHVDINREVFNRNFPARVAIEADAGVFVADLLPRLTVRPRPEGLIARIAEGHRSVTDDWDERRSEDRVTPYAFFEACQRLAPDAIYTTDSGNGTFLAMEHLRLDSPGRFIGPIDFSCMGYAVPGAIGAKLANPARDVIALAGDGALLMTGLELLTASRAGVSPVVCVLRDGELAQIAQFQRTAMNRDTCSVLAPYRVEDFARAVEAEYLLAATDADLDRVLPRALEGARAGRPVMVEVAIDYSRRTYFTRGVVSTNFWRLPLGDRLRALGRVVARRLSRG
jgi:acetolactate synthase-1/2/3 large subunit